MTDEQFAAVIFYNFSHALKMTDTHLVQEKSRQKLISLIRKEIETLQEGYDPCNSTCRMEINILGVWLLHLENPLQPIFKKVLDNA